MYGLWCAHTVLARRQALGCFAEEDRLKMDSQRPAPKNASGFLETRKDIGVI